MQIFVHNPDFPKDRSKAVSLTAKQFELLHDDIIAFMNRDKRETPSKFEARLIKKLAELGDPVIFTKEVTAFHITEGIVAGLAKAKMPLTDMQVVVLTGMLAVWLEKVKNERPGA